MNAMVWPAGPDQLDGVEAMLWRASADGRVATVAELGGWPAVLAAAGQLKTSPLLPEFARTLAAESDELSDLTAATGIVVDAVASTSSLGVLTDATDVLLDAPSLLSACAEPLSDACLKRVTQRNLTSAALAGAALEVAVRLALGRWVPEFDVLSVLVRLRAVEPFAFARSAVRCLGAAYDEWRDDRLVAALRALAGIDATPAVAGDRTAAGTVVNSEDLDRIAPEVAFELGQCMLGAALASPSWDNALPSLAEAHRLFTAAREDGDRPDARVMVGVIGLLADHLGNPLDPIKPSQKAADLSRNVREHLAGFVGLPPHWRAPRVDAEVAWAQLARDVATTMENLNMPSWYDAARIAERVLATYTASRCSSVLRADDVTGIQSLLAPRIERGIGSRAALMRHLADHVVALEERSAQGEAAGVGRELETARHLLAQAQVAGTEGVVLPKGGNVPIPVAPGRNLLSPFPQLAELLADRADALTRLTTADAEATARVEAALEDAQAAAGNPRVESLVFAEAFSRCRADLLSCTDYRDQVRVAVDEILDLLLKFVRDRTNRSRSRAPYLFTPDASEADLANDLELFLAASLLSSYVHTEVRDIGGGRVDIAFFYERFTLVIELKQEHADVSVDAMRRYLSQVAAYTGSDVTVGFLVVLDLRPKETPPTDLRSSAFVVVADDSRLGRPRHVTTFLVAGNRRNPSAMEPVEVQTVS